MRSNHLTIGIVAHVDAGKTTLSESILYLSGAIRKFGRVDHKDAFLDTDEIERQRGITVFAKEARFSIADKEFTLLDTPGHSDFSSETERSLSVRHECPQESSMQSLMKTKMHKKTDKH